MHLIDYHADLVSQAGSLGLVRTQDIPASFLDSLADCRAASAQRAGDVHRVASVPAALVDKWRREGFDIFREPARAIVKRLRDEGFDGFIATNKRV